MVSDTGVDFDLKGLFAMIMTVIFFVGGPMFIFGIVIAWPFIITGLILSLVFCRNSIQSYPAWAIWGSLMAMLNVVFLEYSGSEYFFKGLYLYFMVSGGFMGFLMAWQIRSFSSENVKINKQQTLNK